MSGLARICLIGFGEVGQTLAADLRQRKTVEIAVWDIQFVDAASAPSRAAEALGLRKGLDARDAVAGAELVICAVTAGQDFAATEAAAPHLEPQAWFLDVNSVSPGVRERAAREIGRCGGRYVEAAIMAPISPKRIASPMLFGGPHAAAFLPIARELGFTGAERYSDQIGRASAAKLCRSVLVKGLEALLAESLLAARRHGVEDVVIESLRNLFPAENWRTLARYMISRSLVHGVRRAEEMREAAQTVKEAGLDAWMSRATAERQAWAAQFRSAAAHEDLIAMLDALLADADAQESAPSC